MKKGIKITLISLAVVVVIASAGLLYVTRINAIDMISIRLNPAHPSQSHPAIMASPTKR